MPASVVTFWSKVLAGRAQSFDSGGLGAEAPYETAGSPTRVEEEVSRLIRESGNVRYLFWFPDFFDSRSGVGAVLLPASQSWQMFDADGMAAVESDGFVWKAGR